MNQAVVPALVTVSAVEKWPNRGLQSNLSCSDRRSGIHPNKDVGMPGFVEFAEPTSTVHDLISGFPNAVFAQHAAPFPAAFINPYLDGTNLHEIVCAVQSIEKLLSNRRQRPPRLHVRDTRGTQ